VLTQKHQRSIDKAQTIQIIHFRLTKLLSTLMKSRTKFLSWISYPSLGWISYPGEFENDKDNCVNIGYNHNCEFTIDFLLF
jgi:hypothetical protein